MADDSVTALTIESLAHDAARLKREASELAADAHVYREMALMQMRTIAEQRAEIRKLRYRLKDQAEQIRALMGVVS